MSVKIKWRRGAFAEVRTLPKTMAEVTSLAEQVGSRAGEGFEVRSATETGGRVRGRASVGTTDYVSRRRNAKNNTLIKALGGGG